MRGKWVRYCALSPYYAASAAAEKLWSDSVTSAAATRKTTGEVLCFGSSLVNPTRAPNIVGSVGHYCIGGAALPILVILR